MSRVLQLALAFLLPTWARACVLRYGLALLCHMTSELTGYCWLMSEQELPLFIALEGHATSLSSASSSASYPWT